MKKEKVQQQFWNKNTKKQTEINYQNFCVLLNKI
jgi:hypothetical protein